MKSEQILRGLRKNVNDFYSITALHYLNAGTAGIDHFHFLLNGLISNVNLSSLEELNTVFAHVLHKGHGKDRNNARSYRTISTCPILAKALDIYVRELSMSEWNSAQSQMQFQGHGMSHELACLLLTETLQFSLNVAKKPVYALFLDAKSAFDRVLRERLIRNLFLIGTDDHRLLHIDNRLGSRRTFCEFDKVMMGPILDTRGLEQGGVFSSDAYKIYNNEQADVAQASGLGVYVKNVCISCITMADDAVLVSNNIIDLNNLLFLTEQYCSKYDVQLVPDKIRLLAFSKNEMDIEYSKEISPINISNMKIAFSEEAEHLGVIRTSSATNMTNLMARISAHRAKLFSLLPSGLAFHHQANPAAVLKVERLYAAPVLLSGLASLVLSKEETSTLQQYHKNCLQKLMKLPDRTPSSSIYFLAGSLPNTALLHLRQFSLFDMICHMPESPLHVIVKESLITSNKLAKSWSQCVRDLSIQYQLPHPLTLLDAPMASISYKKLCKIQVQDYWHRKLSCDAMITSLKYLRSFAKLSPASI